MKYLLLCLIFALPSCNVSKPEGLYSSKRQVEKYLLSSDSTYRYESAFMHTLIYSTGKWKMGEGDTILLYSDRKDTVKTDMHFERALDDSISIHVRLQVLNKSKDVNYGIWASVNNKFFDQGFKDFEAILRYKGPVDSISIYISKYYQWSNLSGRGPGTAVLYTNGCMDDIYINITLEDYLFHYVVMQPLKLRLRKRHILNYNEYLNQWYKISRISDSTRVYWHSKQFSLKI